jgi:ABC-type ATPase involved in cell division
MLGHWLKSNGAKNSNSEPLIYLRQVVKEYGSLAGDVVALKGIDLQVNTGEFAVITGKSCGAQGH